MGGITEVYIFNFIITYTYRGLSYMKYNDDYILLKLVVEILHNKYMEENCTKRIIIFINH